MKNLRKSNTPITIEEIIRDFLSQDKYSYLLFIKKRQHLNSILLRKMKEKILKEDKAKKILFLKSEWMIGEVFCALKNDSFKEYLLKLNKMDILLIERVDNMQADNDLLEIMESLFKEFLSKNRKIIATSETKGVLFMETEKILVIELD